MAGEACSRLAFSQKLKLRWNFPQKPMNTREDIL
jgi:hypothetical protein